jgi:hypothetical protein
MYATTWCIRLLFRRWIRILRDATRRWIRTITAFVGTGTTGNYQTIRICKFSDIGGNFLQIRAHMYNVQYPPYNYARPHYCRHRNTNLMSVGYVALMSQQLALSYRPRLVQDNCIQLYNYCTIIGILKYDAWFKQQFMHGSSLFPHSYICNTRDCTTRYYEKSVDRF